MPSSWPRGWRTRSKLFFSNSATRPWVPAEDPSDFMLQLTEDEKTEVVANCDHLTRLKFSPNLPYAFTEHGTVMLASVLNSPVAVQASVQVVRAFIRIREILASHRDLARKLQELEKKYDANFKNVFDVIRKLMTPPPPPSKKRIGFSPAER